MSIWQTKAWGDMLEESGQAKKVFNINGIQIEQRKVAMGEYGLFILGLEKRDVKTFKEQDLINICKKESCLFIQIELIDYDNLSLGSNIFSNFKQGYYKKFITPYTAVIDLEKTEEEILALMKQKGRYNIRLSEKKGVIVKKVVKTDENIKHFYKLLLETTKRDNFFGNTFDYYKTFLTSIENSELFLAYIDDIIIAGGIFVFDKEVFTYYYGASTSNKEYRNLMAPYLVQWDAIRYAKSIGSKIYDFLGVANPNDKNSSLLGVTDFKLKFTDDVRLVSDSYIWINKKFKYKFTEFFRKLIK